MKKRTYLAIIALLSLMYGQAMVFAANNTTGSAGIVIKGDNNTVSSSNSITLGNEISSLGGANVAIGYQSKAGNQGHPLDPNNANGATAVGTGAQATNYRANGPWRLYHCFRDRFPWPRNHGRGEWRALRSGWAFIKGIGSECYSHWG